MRVAVIGAGGVGGYFAGRLAEAGHHVSVIARGRSVEVLREEGLRIEDPESDTTVTGIDVSDSPDDVGEVDAVIVAVKSWQVPEIAPGLKPLVGDHTVVLPLQNGVEAADQLADGVGEAHVLGGVCMIIAYSVEPGHVRHVGGAVAVELAPLGQTTQAMHGTTVDLQEALSSAGVRCDWSDDIRRAIWRKFLLISSYGGVGALSRQPVGVTRTVAETRSLIEDAMHEVVDVGRAHDVALDTDDVATMMKQLDAFSPDSTASLQRDIFDGKPSELDDQSGAVVRLGAAVGVATPIHRSIYSCLLPSERFARGEDPATDQTGH
jgi:2-dehydropantoate 2-reductase